MVTGGMLVQVFYTPDAIAITQSIDDQALFFLCPPLDTGGRVMSTPEVLMLPSSTSC